jgi:hypothetical protein
MDRDCDFQAIVKFSAIRTTPGSRMKWGQVESLMSKVQSLKFKAGVSSWPSRPRVVAGLEHSRVPAG